MIQTKNIMCMEIVNCKFETHGKFNIDVKINLQNYNH